MEHFHGIKKTVPVGWRSVNAKTKSYGLVPVFELVSMFRCDNLLRSNKKNREANQPISYWWRLDELVRARNVYTSFSAYIQILRITGKYGMLFAWIFSESIILNLLFGCYKFNQAWKKVFFLLARLMCMLVLCVWNSYATTLTMAKV